MGTGKKVKYSRSIGFKVRMMAITAVLLVVGVISSTAFPSIRRNVEKLTKNYLMDNVRAYGTLLEEIAQLQPDFLEKKESLKEMLSDVKMHGMESSYAFLINRDGKIIYHPTEDKIGKPAESPAVVKVVEEMAAGRITEAECIQYEYKGRDKYASYYVNPEGQFVLVITVDEDEVFHSVKYTSLNVLVIELIVIVLVLIGGGIVTREITRPLTQLTESIAKVADLDLTEPAQIGALMKRKDEVGCISRAVHGLHMELIDVIKDITDQSEQLNNESNIFTEKFTSIAESVREVSQAVEDIAQGSTSQAQETTGASEKVLDMGEAVEQNNKSIYELDQSIDQMNEYAESAKKSLNEVMSITDQTMKDMEVVYEQSNNTNDSAKKIGEAIQLIQDIAVQTNLLSLNASIEAARAGEAGRGFSVVAGEIRRLAENSNESAKLINETVQELVQNSQESVNRIEQLREGARLQLQKLEETNTTYDGLKEEVARVSKNSDCIADRIGEMTQIRVSVSEAMEQLAAIAEENAASTQETSAGITTLSDTIEDCKEQTKELYHLSEELRNQTSKFKV